MKTLIKLLIVAILCTTLLITGVSGAFATQNSDNTVCIGKIGDNDGTDVVTVKDATRIQKHLVSIITFSENEKVLADANGDGRVTIKDASEIQKWISDCSDNTIINSPFYCEAFSISIRTSDADTGSTIGGYTYGIYADKECTKLLEEVSSAPTYVSIHSNNKYVTGTYFIKQIAVAANYEFDSEVYEVNVSESNSVNGCVWTVIRSKLSPKMIYIKAYDEDNYNPEYPLRDMDFGVYTDKGCSQQVCVIKNGQYSNKIFKVGKTYYIKDINAAPDGYNSSSVYEVTIPNAQYLDIVAVTIPITNCN